MSNKQYAQQPENIEAQTKPTNNKVEATMSNKLSTTTISGMPRKFNDDELQARQDRAVSGYLNSPVSKYQLQSTVMIDFMRQLESLQNDGFRIDFSGFMTTTPVMSAYLHKPESILSPELDKIHSGVKEQYISELKEELESYKSKLIQQRMEETKEKERRTQLEKDRKLRQQFEAEANEVFGSLEDI